MRAMSPFDFDEEQQAIRAAIAGDNSTDALAQADVSPDQSAANAQAAQWDAPPAPVPTASDADVSRALTQNLTPRNPPPDDVAPERPWIQAAPDAPARKSLVGDVDPGLAFMAAFSQNPMLAKMVDEQRNRPRMEAEEARQGAQDTRAQQRWEMDRDIMSPLRAQAKRNENVIGGAKAALYMGDSPQSKAARDAGAMRLRADAERVNNPQIKKLLEAHASYIETHPDLSAMDVHQRLSKDELGGIGSAAASDAFRAAQQAETSRMNDEKMRSNAAQEELGKGKLALEWAKLSARKEAAGNKSELTLRGGQEKLNKEINNLDISLQNMKEIGKLKGNVDTGIYAAAFTDFLQKWISSDLTSEDRKNLNSLVARTFNRETKELAGSAVSASEWARIEPQIPQKEDDDALFMAKLNKAIEVTNEILKARREEYELKGGKPIDQSTTAAKNVRAAQKAGERPMSDATPKGDAKTAAAKAWLQANPNDPRAEKVRKRLHDMGAL